MPEKILLKIGAAYIRVSDERQDEYSPDSQLKKIREHAAKEGRQIPDEYVFYDDGISGKSTKKRDDFNRMISLAKDKDCPFDIIYVWKFSRFARNQEESLVYKNLLRKIGIDVCSVSENIPEGPFGSLIERIIEWMDEFYLINLGAEVTRGMTEKASRGEPTCAPPYGYDMKNKEYIINEHKAPHILEIFERFDAGSGMREIATIMGQKGVRTKFGKMPDNRWIEYVLRNPCYIGKIRWSLDGARAVSKRDFSNEKIMTVDGHHEPIIPMALWESVQNKLEEQKKLHIPYSREDQPADYLLKGLVRCSACGATLVRTGTLFSKKNKTYGLQCHNYARGSCHTSHSISMTKLESAFIEGLESAIRNQTFTIIPKKKDVNSNTTDYDKLIAVENKKLLRAKEAYLEGIDSLEQYKESKATITAKIEALNALKSKEDNLGLPNTKEYTKKVISIVDFIKREDISLKAKNEALKSIIEKIVYEKANKNLAIYFHSI